MRHDVAARGTLIRVRTLIAAFAVAAAGILVAERHPAAALQDQAAPRPSLTDQEIEQFLTKARVIKTKGISKGVTGTIKATLTDGTLTHDAQIQIIDETKQQFQTASGTEFNFRDSWKFNVAGYRVDRLIGLNMVPVSVPRRWGRNDAAFTWWIDDVMMEEGERIKKKLVAPDIAFWNEQLQLVRVFDQLIFNIDRNLGNLVITKDWRVWAVDHTRAFRTHSTLKSPENMTRCDRQMIERMKALDRATLDRSLGQVLTEYEIKAILDRRDLIVKHFEARPALMFDRRTAS